jgi:signal transduction histidine kinase
MLNTTVSFALARYVFISCVGLAVIITSLVNSHVVELVNTEYEKIASREINSLNNGYRAFISNHLILLKEQSQTPLFVQALMQPTNNLGKLKDFMSGLTLLGMKYEEVLLDFEGTTLHSTSGESTDYKKMPWLQVFLNEAKNSSIQVIKIEGNFFWCLAYPVIYNKQVEGILLANIPIEAIHIGQIDIEVLDGLMITIEKDENIITTFGKQAIGNNQLIDWPDAGISFNYTLDEGYQNKAITNLVIQLGSYIILAIVLTTLLAYLYGYRYFVKPIVALSKLTTSLEKGERHQELEDKLMFKEFAGLFKQFNLMSDKVAKRELDLKQSYRRLSNANEELKQSESQLVQSEKMASIGVLAAGVAHEINNPIGFIRSNLEVLEEYFSDVEKYHQEFNDSLMSTEDREIYERLAKKYELAFLFKDAPPLIQSSISGIDRVAEIVQNLKTFARVDQPDKALIDINEGIKATLNMVHNELKYCCTVNLDLQPLPKITGFPGKLNQVFMNLLINAGQAMTEKGELFVRSFIADAHIVIEIEDTGKGIEADKIAQIFVPFFTSKPIGEGTGLGLSISHQIIKQHNGEITAKSELGKGSCFTVYLPID